MPDIIVKNQTELNAAIKAAKGGETIKLAAGTYTDLTVMTKAFTSMVTFQSLDPSNPVNIQKLVIGNSSNITVKNMVAATDYKPADDWNRLNTIQGSTNIVLDGVRFSGGTGDPSLSKGAGLFVRDSKSVTMKNSSIDHFGLGLEAYTVDGMVVQNSSFHDNRRDHTNFTEMNNLVIDGNTFTNLFPVGAEHPDAIQFFTAGKVKGNTNITISNNVIMQGSGSGAQGIFMNDEAGNLPYVNVNIKNNLIYLNGYYHGINVVNGVNVNIESNSVISQVDGTSFWIRLDKTNGATIKNNIADLITVTSSSSNIVQTNNRTLTSDSATIRKIYGLNDGAKARLSDLIVPGVGYQPPVPSAAAAQVATELSIAKAANPSLLLDLSFGKDGVVDLSHWNTGQTTKAVDVSAVVGSAFHVSTGTGVELNRDYSRQIYALSAFTLSFDLKRDSATATAGQILGIYQSWSVSLQANGELSFTMRNAAGVSQTMVTSGAKLLDAATHKIALTYDSARKTAILYVDGMQRGVATMTGTTRPAESWGLYVGSPFSTAFSGTVGDIEIRDGAISAAQVQSLVTASSASAATTVKYSLVTGAAAQAAALLASAGNTGTATPLATVATVGSTLSMGTSASSQLALVSKLGVDMMTAGVMGATRSAATLSAAADQYNLYRA